MSSSSLEDELEELAFLACGKKTNNLIALKSSQLLGSCKHLTNQIGGESHLLDVSACFMLLAE